MDKQPYLDISLMKNQNFIALKLADMFSLEELEILEFENINIAPSKRDISEPINTVYEVYFEGNRVVQVLDIFLLNVYPIVRFVNLRLIDNGAFQMDFKCKHSKKVCGYLAIILAKAINYSKYKSKTDIQYIKNNIITNFSTLLANSMSLGGLEELRFISEYINNEDKVLTDSHFEFKFKIENVDFKMTCTPYLIKYQFTKDGKTEYIYLQKNKIGIASCSLIIEKALQTKLKNR